MKKKNEMQNRTIRMDDEVFKIAKKSSETLFGKQNISAYIRYLILKEVSFYPPKE